MEKLEVEKLVSNALKCHQIEDDLKHEELKKVFLTGMKEIKDSVDEMTPTVSEIKDFGTFFKVGKSIGMSAVFLITATGIIVGAIFAIKEWIKR